MKKLTTTELANLESDVDNNHVDCVAFWNTPDNLMTHGIESMNKGEDIVGFANIQDAHEWTKKAKGPYDVIVLKQEVY